MSGPKIVRVVTREELQAEGLMHLRAVDAALAQCERTARRHDAWTDERSRALAARRQELERLYQHDRWSELRRAAPIETSFLQDELARVTGAAVEAAELALRRRRRLGDAARSIVQALEAERRAVPAELLTMAERARRGRDDDLSDLESELNVAMRALGTGGTGAGTAEQMSLAERLASGEQGQTYAEWSARRAATEREPDVRVIRLMAELSVLAPQQAAPFLTRMDLIAQERAADRRALLTDSLVLDVGTYVAKEKAWSAQLPGLEQARSMLEALASEEASGLRTRLETALVMRDAEAAMALIAEIRALADGETRRRLAAARRQAVLKGLATLGYEVREHMETAWAEGGRVIVRKAGASDYGVELGAPTNAERIQLRLVGSATPVEPRTASRDRDAEVQWCSQVRELSEVLGGQGSELIIERALAAGAQLVKTVAFDDARVTDLQRVESPRPRERQR